MGVFVKAGGQKSPGSGRQKGARNKISTQFLEALANDFETNGKGVIEIMRVEKPVEYCKVIASLLPKEFEITENRLAEIPDDELDFIIEYTRRQLATRLERNASREDQALN
jgi:transcriptional/translational regulatory protein YebC/TACO1